VLTRCWVHPRSEGLGLALNNSSTTDTSYHQRGGQNGDGDRDIVHAPYLEERRNGLGLTPTVIGKSRLERR